MEGSADKASTEELETLVKNDSTFVNNGKEHHDEMDIDIKEEPLETSYESAASGLYGVSTLAETPADNLGSSIQVMEKSTLHTCSICGKSFGRKSTLNRHRRIHERAELPRDGASQKQDQSDQSDSYGDTKACKVVLYDCHPDSSLHSAENTKSSGVKPTSSCEQMTPPLNHLKSAVEKFYRCACSETFARRSSLLEHMVVCKEEDPPEDEAGAGSLDETSISAEPLPTTPHSSSTTIHNNDSQAKSDAETSHREFKDTPSYTSSDDGATPLSDDTEETQNLMYSCPTCGESFSDKLDLSKHEKLCQDDEAGTPEMSDFSDGDSDDLYVPPTEAEHHKQGNFTGLSSKKRCGDDDQDSDDSDDPDEVEDKPRKRSYTPKSSPMDCEICGETVLGLKNLRAHTRICKVGRTYLCDLCSKVYTRKSEFTKHVRSHKDKESHKCKVCKESFQSAEDLSKHFDTHKLNCKLCKKTFLRKLNLEKHMASHDVEKPPQPNCPTPCPVCGKTFKSEYYMKYHIRAIHDAEKPFKCDKCDKSFPYNLSLRDHMVTHTGEKPHKCTICDQTFTIKTSLRRHMKMHTDGKQFSCPVCEKYFSTKHNRDLHVQGHMVSQDLRRPKYTCDICFKSFTEPGNLHKHKKRHTEERAFQCTMCEKAFKVVQDYNRHMKWVHATEQTELTEEQKASTTCTICNKGFSSTWALKEHMRTHTDERPFKCNSCDKTFKHETSLKSHMYLHELNGAKPFMCQTCGKCFARSYVLNIHMRSHEGNRPFMCSYCSKTFATRHVWRLHEMKHTGETRFLCNTCGRGFIHRQDYKQHMLAHENNESPNKTARCTLCDQRFQSLDNYNAHMKKHTSDKPFMCKICDDCFAVESELNTHHLAHREKARGDDKQFSCTVCGKCFGAKRNLLLHKRVHTGEKPYKCNYCDRRCADRTSMVYHTRTHTGEKPYKCPLCDKKFAQSSSRISHMRVHGVQEIKHHRIPTTVTVPVTQ